MKFRFPVIIIDEDFRSENASASASARSPRAIEAEGSRCSASRVTAT